MMIYVGVIALLSIAGAAGYWLRRRWGWTLHLLAAIGLLLFPGMLFELKLDAYHLFAWISPPLSLICLALMWKPSRRW
jgi:uncharacterized membrane protein YgdD (TMEM256/DUF423 family)